MSRMVRTINLDPNSTTQEIQLHTPSSPSGAPPLILGAISAVGSNEAALVVADDPAYDLQLGAMLQCVAEGTTFEQMTGLSEIGKVRMLDGSFRIVAQ